MSVEEGGSIGCSPQVVNALVSTNQLHAFRTALQAGDADAALRCLEALKQQAYPPGLLRSLLAPCHPGLDAVYLDPQLVPEALLLAARFPQLAVRSGLDPLRIALSHGCDLASFASQHLNPVLLGDKPLYAGLPALEIRHYQQLLQLDPVRGGCLRQRSVLACLAMEPGPSDAGQAEPLRRWQASRHDQLLDTPWVLIVSSGQEDAFAKATSLGVAASIPVHDLASADALCRDAASRLFQGGAHYLLWRGDQPPEPIWADWIRGLVALRRSPLVQLGEVDGAIGEVIPPRFQRRAALLAIDARWLARRQPRQVQAFVHHWLEGPSQTSKVRLDPALVLGPAPIARPSRLQGLLVLAATGEQVRLHGFGVLQQRVRAQAVRGGFQDGAVLQLAQPLATQLAAFAKQGWVWVFMGPDDSVAPAAWSRLRQRLSWQPHQLLCSDEELLWCAEPRRRGQRQFAAAPTPLRLLVRGLLPGLVAVPAEHWDALDLQPTYNSLHALLRHLGLQWLAHKRPITCLPQALLVRQPGSNPAVLPISTPGQRSCFSDEQLVELERITEDCAAPWLAQGGSLQPGSLPGTFVVRFSPSPQDRVSVIIPFRNQAQLTRSCVLSLLEQAGPVPLEFVLVDNGSNQEDAINLAMELTPRASDRGVRVIGLRDERPFNFAALNNRALQSCSGNFVLFLNNDIRFESPAPIEALLHPFGLALTGAVGARLLYEDGTIQHHGLAAAAGQPHDILSPGKGLRPGLETDLFTVLQVQEEWSAATAACLLMRREDFDRLGGFDESFEVAYNDVDLCWRLAQQGQAVVVTPEPLIIHAESKSRGDDFAGEKRNRLARESGALRRRFPQHFQQGDPLYHPFLGPASHRFEPMSMPSLPLGPSRDRLLYSWVRSNFQPAPDRHFLVYVHWDPDGQIRPDVLEQLRAYRRHVDVAFVSASPQLIERQQLINHLHNLCDILLIRHNEGYDFGSWKTGLQFCERWVRQARRLILTNDSCYGPLQSLDSLFQRLDSTSADVVGLTGSTAIRRHLQSYFLAHSQRVIQTPLFWTFWDQIGCWGSKVELVLACEVGWSAQLEKAGFSLEALYLDGCHGNITHTHWRHLLEDLQFPFLKTELLRLNPIRQDIDDWFEVASRLNPAMARSIREHLGQAGVTAQR
jgi:GT2 family glycosyltransferase